MNNKTLRQAGAVLTGAAVVAALVLNAITPPGWSKSFTPSSQGSLWLQQNNPPTERVDNNLTHWSLYVGSPNTGVTHYARLRYGLPEFEGMVLTRFYLAEVIRLPANFYAVNNDMRILNTDNYSARLNGVTVGASGGAELRTSVYITADRRVRVRSEHQGRGNIDWYISAPEPAFLSPGEWHTVELFGNLAAVEPWYFRVDGVVIAQGVAMLSNPSVPVAERIMTRAVWGADGAYRLVIPTPLELQIRSVTVADTDPNGMYQPVTNTPTALVTIPPASATATRTVGPPTATAAPVTRTATPVPPSATPTNTANPVPTECHFYDSGGLEICIRRVP